MRLSTFWIVVCAMAVCAMTATGLPADKDRTADSSKLPAAATRTVDFITDIQPIFADRCYECHGPEKHKSGLRLDRKADALAGGDNGKAITPGKSAESLLIRNVLGQNPDTVMPPKGERLSRFN